MVITVLGALAIVQSAQPLSGATLMTAVRSGGYVIVMRHASSPRETPDKQTANPDNVKLERQLDAAGRAGATAMGQALADLKVPVGEVLTSPTYRAMETVRLAKLPDPQPRDELGDGGQSMQGASDTQAAWLRSAVSKVPKGANTIIVTQMPNIARAFPEWGAVADGESVVLQPDGKGGATVVGRITIDEWRRLR
jgi:hypothetical protein